MSELADAIDRIPPHNEDAERSVLGSMLVSEKAVIDACELLSPEDFYIPGHRGIYDAMLRLHNQRKPVDLVTVTERLTASSGLNDCGGVMYLSDLSRSVPSTANVRYYIDIVVDKSTLRKLVSAGSRISVNAYEADISASEQVETAHKEIFDIAMKKDSDSLRHIEDSLMNVYDQIGEAAKNKGELIGLSTGFKDLDKKTAGFQGSQLIILAARPGMGKTSMALNILRNTVEHDGVPVALFSLEMSREQLAMRMLCSGARIDMQRARVGDLRDHEFADLAREIQRISTLPIYLDDTSAISVSGIRGKCRKLMADKGLGMIVIDYLQLMQSTNRVENRQLEISSMTRELKGLARELNVPILLLSQLSRAPEQRARGEHRPKLSDLRESGAIEQDADIVMFLYRDSVYDEDDEEQSNLTELIIAKHRNGQTGTIDLAWLGEYTLFQGVERYRTE